MDKFAPRPFPNVATMNQTIIDNWNTKVGEHDIVYHLGDIALYFTKPRKAYEAVADVLGQLHGRLVLVKGNHDSRALFKYLAAHNFMVDGHLSMNFMMWGPFKVQPPAVLLDSLPNDAGNCAANY